MKPVPTLLMLEAQHVAIEHVLWAASQKMTPRQVLLRAGIDWPARGEPDWHDCVSGLAIAWRRLKWTAPSHERRIS